jgi:large subunit ribosomal protein L3
MLYTLLGQKIGMTRIYEQDANLIPVTVIKAGPCPVIQVKTQETDGYNAIQIAYEEKKPSRTTKPIQGHFKKANTQPHRTLKEIRTQTTPKEKVGEKLTVTVFQEGQKVDIIGTTKGRGFQGVVKRHNFSGGPSSHGSMFHRRGGSYGQCQWPGEVHKGKRMPGRMGNDQRTVQNLKVVKILPEENIILVKGSIPGANGTNIIIRNAKKQNKSTE